MYQPYLLYVGIEIVNKDLQIFTFGCTDNLLKRPLSLDSDFQVTLTSLHQLRVSELQVVGNEGGEDKGGGEREREGPLRRKNE